MSNTIETEKKPLIFHREDFDANKDFTLVAEGFWNSIICAKQGKTGEDAERWINNTFAHYDCSDFYREFGITEGGGVCTNDDSRTHFVFGMYMGSNLNLPSKYSCPIHREWAGKQLYRETIALFTYMLKGEEKIREGDIYSDTHEIIHNDGDGRLGVCLVMGREDYRDIDGIMALPEKYYHRTQLNWGIKKLTDKAKKEILAGIDLGAKTIEKEVKEKLDLVITVTKIEIRDYLKNESDMKHFKKIIK